MYYTTVLNNVFEVNDTLKLASQKKRLIKSLIAKIIQDKLSFKKSDVEGLKRKCLSLIVNDCKSLVSANYMLDRVGAAALVGAQIRGSRSIYKPFLHAKNGAFVDLVKHFFSVHKVQSNDIEIEIIEAQVLSKPSYSFQSRTNLDFDDSDSAYARVSILKLFVEESFLNSGITQQYLKDNWKTLQCFLSAARLLLIIYDIENNSVQNYHSLLELKKLMISRENNAAFVEMQEIVFESQNKAYFYGYRIDAGHFNLFEDYADDWYESIIKVICDPKISCSSDMLKVISGHLNDI